MFTFMHTYTPDSWDGLTKHGLFRRGDGLKVLHAGQRPDWFRFNQMAAIGSPLEQKLRELRCPFYIDRLQGGVGLSYLYPFDPALLHHYRTLLGDKFWGFQMHERSSNYRSDYDRITQLYETYGTPKPTPIERHSSFQDVRSGKKPLFLETLTPEEWSSRRNPVNRAMFLNDIRLLYETRCRMTGYNHAAEALVIPFSLRDGQDEWGEDQLHKGTGADRTPEERERGGTSVNLQERLWRFAYHAGATVISEEYGVCNTSGIIMILLLVLMEKKSAIFFPIRGIMTTSAHRLRRLQSFCRQTCRFSMSSCSTIIWTTPAMIRPTRFPIRGRKAPGYDAHTVRYKRPRKHRSCPALRRISGCV